MQRGWRPVGLSVYLPLLSSLAPLKSRRSTAKQVAMVWACAAKEDTDWVKKCIEYEVEGSRPRGRPKRTWKEVVQKDCQAHNLNKEDTMDHGRWKKLIKIG